MTPAALQHLLTRLLRADIRRAVMIWGPPGVGKSSIVASIASGEGIGFTDVRLSQLAPTDLRGLPVPEGGISRWLPPEFLPREGRGVLFFDEINMAPPAVQGIAQQLVLDRRVGSYKVPDGWLVWAAGNRKEDHAAVFDMPSPLANRFLHLEVEPDYASFRDWAIHRGIHEQVLAFLSFRPELLHKLEPTSPSWPSPRTWEMASELHTEGLDVGPAVGAGAKAEFDAFVELYAKLPELEKILSGEGGHIRFPEEPSLRYAAVVGLAARVVDARQASRGMRWLQSAGAEWVQLYVAHLMVQMRARGLIGQLALAMKNDEVFKKARDEMNAALWGSDG